MLLVSCKYEASVEVVYCLSLGLLAVLNPHSAARCACKYSVELLLLTPLDCSIRNLSLARAEHWRGYIYVYTSTVTWTRFNSVGVVTWVVAGITATLSLGDITE